ncbi:hypothetical protein PspLS_10157 [Pyricularia sp. CBS 133598]|nr:hypothetical protein PspLS_10157 [Pyricularia sp. CBS 133598]
MRLINARTLNTKEFFGRDIPEYAILSHTWGDDEPTLQQWKTKRGRAATGDGVRKIYDACKQAVKYGYEWLWADTVCIDKTNQMELSEAINSMYDWYRKSEECYALLQDVPDVLVKNSKWFTRGWTLQELIAPKRVIFFNKEWLCLGTRTTLEEEICEATGMDGHHLILATSHTKEEWLSLGNQPTVATKMSWVASRKTTKPEDRAYCMLGIFGINMPLLYGEGGQRAFLRLQEEIIRTSNDQTIFCWRREREGKLVPEGWTSLLAPTPELYADLPHYVRHNTSIQVQGEWSRPRTYSMTNAGLRISLPIVYATGYFFAFLDVTFADNRVDGRIALALKEHGEPGTNLRWSPVSDPVYLTSFLWNSARETELYVNRGSRSWPWTQPIFGDNLPPLRGLLVVSSSIENYKVSSGYMGPFRFSRPVMVVPEESFDFHTSIFTFDNRAKSGATSHHLPVGGMLALRLQDGRVMTLLVGADGFGSTPLRMIVRILSVDDGQGPLQRSLQQKGVEWADAVIKELLNVTGNGSIYNTSATTDEPQPFDQGGLATKPPWLWGQDILQRAVAGVYNGADPNEPVRHDERWGIAATISKVLPLRDKPGFRVLRLEVTGTVNQEVTIDHSRQQANLDSYRSSVTNAKGPL